MKKMTACFIQAFDLFPYLFCFFRKALMHLSLKKIWSSKRKETDKWPIIQTHWKTFSLHLLYIKMQTELKIRVFQLIKSLHHKSAVWILRYLLVFNMPAHFLAAHPDLWSLKWPFTIFTFLRSEELLLRAFWNRWVWCPLYLGWVAFIYISDLCKFDISAGK